MCPGALVFRLLKADPASGAPAVGDPAAEKAPPAFNESFIAQLRKSRCGVIVGNHGTGKSTLLRELAGQLELDMPGGAWVQLTQSNHLSEILSNVRTLTQCLRTAASGGVIVIDGAEQIPALVRRWIAWRCRRHQQFVLATSHHDITGYETLYRTGLTPGLITELVDDLLPDSTDETSPTLRSHVQDHLRTLNLDEIKNLRDLWDDLYEVAESFQGGQRQRV